MLYLALGDEIDLGPLFRDALSSGRLVALPGYDAATGAYLPRQVVDPARDLNAGAFGITEPRGSCPLISPNRLDFAIVPGVAFTLEGRRIGRGKGHYDRLLASVGGVKCGVAYDEQIVEAIPSEPHDVRMDWIVTPTRSVRAGERDARF